MEDTAAAHEPPTKIDVVERMSVPSQEPLHRPDLEEVPNEPQVQLTEPVEQEHTRTVMPDSHAPQGEEGSYCEPDGEALPLAGSGRMVPYAPKDVDRGTLDAAEQAQAQGAIAQERAHQLEMDRLLWISLPKNDQLDYHIEHDNSDEWPELNEPGPSGFSNRGQKLHAHNGVRWMHRGKLVTWTERRSDHELREREERRIDAFQHASVDAMLEAEATGPGGMGGIWRTQVLSKRRGRHSDHYASKRAKTQLWDPQAKYDLVEDAWEEDDKNARHASTLAFSLLVPVLTARGLLESKLLKQSFRNPHLTSLNRAALNLIENENVMYRALGRCFDTMEHLTGKEGPVPVKHDQHHTDVTVPMDYVPPLAHMNDLFITNEGFTVPVSSSEHENETNSTYTLSADEQREIVYSSLQCLNDLHADSREYMERLGEVRMMLAEVRRDRNHMWGIIRKWALERESLDYQASLRQRRHRAGMDDMVDASSSHEAAHEKVHHMNDNAPESESRRTEWSTNNRNRGKRRSGR